MIVVITGGGYPANEVMPAIAKSIASDRPLPANADAVKQMKARVAEAAVVPPAVAPADLPAMAKTVSGVAFEFPRNASRIDGLTLTFSGKNEARLVVKYLGTTLNFPVGLDGVYRLGPYGPLNLLAGATGHWTSDTEFALDLNFISNINHYTITLHFAGDQVLMDVAESSGLIRNGHITGHKA